MEPARRGSLSPARATGAAVTALVLAGAVLRFSGLAHQGFWFDEANTALLVKFSPGHMLGLIPQTESTPPLYYCVAWVWARLFGFGEGGLRSLSALAGVLTIPVAWGAAWRLTGSRTAAMMVAALTAFNPLLIWYSQEARSYSLLVLLCALALLAFAVALEDPSPRAMAAWVVACALALATHYYAVVAVAPQMAWLLWRWRRRRAAQIAVALVALCGLALIPLALSQNATGHDSWIAHTPLGLRLAQILPQFLIGTGAPARTALKFAAFVLVAAGLAGLAPALRAGVARPRGALLAGAIALGGFLLSLGFAAAGSDALITRNILPLWLPAAILLAGGLTARPRLGALVTAALCGIGLAAAIGVATTYDLQRPDWRPVARALGPRPRPGGAERLILIQHYKTLLPLSLYEPGMRFLRGRATAHRVEEIDVIAMRSPQQPLCWWGAACNLIPSQMQATYAIPGFRPVWRRRVEQFTILRLVATRPRPVSRRDVAAALRTTSLARDDLILQRP
jgi:mannosyltransferase